MSSVDLVMKGISNPLEVPAYLLRRLGRPPYRHIYQRYYRSKLFDSGCGELMQSCLNKASSEVIGPNFADLYDWYTLIRKRQPETVFEFGSGWSTYVIAKALADNADEGETGGVVYSMEADNRWLEHTQRVLPDNLDKYCNVIYSPVEDDSISGKPVFRHTEIPERDPDIVHLDGPALTEDYRVAADMLSIENGLEKPFLLVVDGREENVQFLRHHLTRDYEYRLVADPMQWTLRQHYFELS